MKSGSDLKCFAFVRFPASYPRTTAFFIVLPVSRFPAGNVVSTAIYLRGPAAQAAVSGLTALITPLYLVTHFVFRMPS